MDRRAGCRSLVCDTNGIIVAETVYRCLLCSEIFDSVIEAKHHYYEYHVDDDDDEDTRQSVSPLMHFGSSLSQSHPNVVRALTRETPFGQSLQRKGFTNGNSAVAQDLRLFRKKAEVVENNNNRSHHPEGKSI